MPIKAISVGILCFLAFSTFGKMVALIDLAKYLKVQLTPIPAIMLTAGASTKSNLTMTEAKYTPKMV